MLETIIVILLAIGVVGGFKLFNIIENQKYIINLNQKILHELITNKGEQNG